MEKLIRLGGYEIGWTAVLSPLAPITLPLRASFSLRASLDGEEAEFFLEQGPHRMAMMHAHFLHEEIESMADSVQWLVLPYLVSKELLGLRLNLPALEEERDRRLIWLANYRFSTIHSGILPISYLYAMQYSRALNHLQRE